MTPEQIFKELAAHFPEPGFSFLEPARNPVSKEITGDPAIAVHAEKIVPVCTMLRQIEKFHFDCLSCLTAVDRKDKFEVVYHLFSYKHRHSVTLKVILARDDAAHLETVESVWPAANWLEREVYDLFGIRFDNHSDLRRIMMPDDWAGYPLRKDYQEAEDYHGITTTRPPLIQ